MKKLLALLLTACLSSTAFAAINLNTATPQQLEEVKGLGPVKAKAIVDYRSKNGAFKTYADLEKVPGIGPKLLEKLKAELVVSGGAATAKPAAKAVAAKPAVPVTTPVKK